MSSCFCSGGGRPLYFRDPFKAHRPSLSLSLWWRAYAGARLTHTRLRCLSAARKSMAPAANIGKGKRAVPPLPPPSPCMFQLRLVGPAAKGKS